MRSCCNCCITNDVGCPVRECRYWIDYKGDLNCCLIAIEKNGAMTLSQVADRMGGTSGPAIKQIQDKTLKKVNKKLKNIKWKKIKT